MKYRLNMFMRRTAPLLLAISLLFACNHTDNTPQPVAGEVTLPLSETEWTYFSFETGAVVGTSEWGNEEEDAKWAQRLDWDIAFCGDKIRTNSGTSGIGEGGIQRNTTTDFYNLTEAPEDGYMTDTDDFPVF